MTLAGTLVDVTMPQMGVSVAEGTIVEWRKQAGDAVQADEVIVSISTDKIDTDVESPASGDLQEILVVAGETVEVGTVLARIRSNAPPTPAPTNAEGGESPSRSDGQTAPGDADRRAEGDAPVAERPARGASGSGAPRAPRRGYSPVVARMAAEHGVDLAQVNGSGRGGRIRKQDLVAHLESGDGDEATAAERPRRDAAVPARHGADVASGGVASHPGPEPAGGHQAPLSRMRQSIGDHMLRSLRTAATCTTVAEADVTGVEDVRGQAGLTALPYIARATIETLAEFPSLNATLEDGTLVTYDGVHLGIAVSLGEDGLIVPVIRNAQDLSTEGLSKRIKELATRARTSRLSPDEVQGGSFTITNPGGYGSIMATPVINQPQVAILDTEAIVKRPVVITDPGGHDAIAIRSMTYLCLSWDHRALDGAIAARFLATLTARLRTSPR